MLDLFSKEIRGSIGRDESLLLRKQANLNSLIDMRSKSVDPSARIAELDSLKREFGYVHFAEKLWLLSESDKSYDDWLLQELNRISSFPFTQVSPSTPEFWSIQTGWAAHVSPKNFYCNEQCKALAVIGRTPCRPFEVSITTRDAELNRNWIREFFNLLFDIQHILEVAFEETFIQYFQEALEEHGEGHYTRLSLSFISLLVDGNENDFEIQLGVVNEYEGDILWYGNSSVKCGRKIQ